MSQYLYFWLLSKGKGWYISMWLNKNRRKGFTMVELIVVLGIIGVLTAIILPFVVGSGKPEEANAKAKSFYYATQNVFTNIKATNTEVVEDSTTNKLVGGGYFTIHWVGTPFWAGSDTDYYFIEAEAQQDEGFTKITVGLFDTSLPGYSVAQQYKCLSESLSTQSPTVYRRQEFTSGDLFDSFNGYTTNDETGYYYAIVDYKCRVVATYWSSDPISVFSDIGTGEFTKDTITFSDNNKIDFSIVGAFPTTKGGIGEEMFDPTVTAFVEEGDDADAEEPEEG